MNGTLGNIRNDKLPGGRVVEIFRNLAHSPIRAAILGEGIPSRASGWRHLQGVSVRGPRAIVTRNRCIFGGLQPPDASDERPLRFWCSSVYWDNDDRFDHLGGIQTIGDWFVVGAENGGQSEVRFYRFDGDAPKIQRHLTVASVSQKTPVPGGDLRQFVAS